MELEHSIGTKNKGEESARLRNRKLFPKDSGGLPRTRKASTYGNGNGDTEGVNETSVRQAVDGRSRVRPRMSSNTVTKLSSDYKTCIISPSFAEFFKN